MKPRSNQFKVTYKSPEATVLVPIEYQLMKELALDRSGSHKYAIRELYNRRQRSTINFI